MKAQPLRSPNKRLGPAAGYIENYTTLLRQLGYSPLTIRPLIQVAARFLYWTQKRHIPVRTLDKDKVERFLRGRSAWCTQQRCGLYRFLGMLRDQGLIPPERKQPMSRQQRLIKDYERYLLEERGLTGATAANIVPFANQFLLATFRRSRRALSQLRAADVTEFVRRHTQKLSPGRAQLLVTALRSFFRYLLHQGKVTTDLAVCVPTVARWSFSTLPKFLPAGSVEKILACSNRQSPIGKRDYAILLLLARLGLRACEVVALNLEDIDWENARITIRAKGGRWNQLPLPADVGEALASYLRDGRPRCSCRRVFIRERAPQTGFAGSQSICALVRTALIRSGVESARKGSHLFRHSLATSMIRRGASLDEIGELLRHRSPNTTAIYAKVDLPALRMLALPWPGGAR